MIETNRFGPEHFSVARSAIRAELIFVKIILFVTVEAAGQR